MEEGELRSVVRGWVGRSNSLRVFVFGKTGAGKSSLINTLFGKEIAEEGETIYSQTKSVTSYSEQRSIKTVRQTIEGVNITMWDSPGLKDPETDESQTLNDIKENCQNVDIFVYCTSLTQTRIGQDEYDSIINLTKVLGDGIWKKGLIALTFANDVRPSPSSRDTAEEYFSRRVSDWREALRSAVKKAGVNNKDAQDIPVVPTSYRDLPLPDTTGADWFSIFWSACIGRTRFVSLPALLRVKRGGLLETPATRQAVTERMIGERLAVLGDKIEREYRQVIGDSYRRMLENPQLLSETLTATVQNQIVWRDFIIGGVLILSMFAVIMVLQHKKN